MEGNSLSITALDDSAYGSEGGSQYEKLQVSRRQPCDDRLVTVPLPPSICVDACGCKDWENLDQETTCVMTDDEGDSESESGE